MFTYDKNKDRESNQRCDRFLFRQSLQKTQKVNPFCKKSNLQIVVPIKNKTLVSLFIR